MCAIFGVLGACEPQRIREAIGRLAHRGPDDGRLILREEWALGVHRLAIESAGTPMGQPLEEKGVFLLFNGEIYNYRPLAVQLGIEGADEARVILAAWRRWGDRFVEQLRGMYAIAIVEEGKGRLHLWRDPVGKKPLFYLQHKGFFAFASEAKALYALKPFVLERRRLVEYLGYQSTIAPHTLDRELRRLEPGEYLRVEKRADSRAERDRAAVPAYATFDLLSRVYDSWLETPIRHRMEEEAARAAERVLEEAVEMRIPSRVSWGVLLSGGLDSSLVAAMAARCTNEPLRTFSIGYEGYAKHDERPWAARVARHLGAEHRSYSMGKEEFFEILEELLGLLDEPLGDPAAIPLYYLMKRVREEGVRVLLGGEGSDELFLGYWAYRRFFEYESTPPLPDRSWMTSYLRSHYTPAREWEWYKRMLEGETLFRSTAETYTDLQLARLLRQNVRDGQNYEAIARYRERFEASDRSDPADWYSYIDLKVMLSEVYLARQDRISMAAGVEARSPFLDRRVIESAFAIDPALRMRSAPKGILKRVAGPYLPETIVSRRKKGLNYPFIEWILEEGGVEAIDRAQRQTGLFRPEQLAFLSARADRGKFRQHLFPLYLLARWLERKI